MTPPQETEKVAPTEADMREAIALAKELDAKATAGPWAEGGKIEPSLLILGGVRKVIFTEARQPAHVASTFDGKGEDNTSFIIAARTLVPKLAAMLEQALAEARSTSKDRLEAALDELVKLQAHYAELLNQYDSGHRICFSSAQQWLERMDELKARNIATGKTEG